MQIHDAISKEKCLRNSIIFQVLDQKSQVELAARAQIRRYNKGEIIFRVDDEAYAMMIIMDGCVRISAQAPNASEITLADLGKNEVFGEIELLGGGRRSANAIAKSESAILALDRKAIFNLIRAKSTLSTNIIRMLCKKVRRSDERMMECAFLNSSSRLARLFLRLTLESSELEIVASQVEIARMAGLSRESVNRCISRWQKSGIVSFAGGTFRIWDREKLINISETCDVLP